MTDTEPPRTTPRRGAPASDASHADARRLQDAAHAARSFEERLRENDALSALAQQLRARQQ